MRPFLIPNYREQKRIERKQKRNFVATIILLFCLAALILCSCAKKESKVGPTNISSNNATILVTLDSWLQSGDSIYYSINLPCLAPNKKTGYTSSNHFSWTCSMVKTGFAYNMTAQSSGYDSLEIKVFVNGVLQSQGNNRSIVTAQLNY